MCRGETWASDGNACAGIPAFTDASISNGTGRPNSRPNTGNNNTISSTNLSRSTPVPSSIVL